MVPLFVGGLPGGPELLIIFLILLLMGLAILLLLAGFSFIMAKGRNDGNDENDQRITRLEREVAELKQRINELED